MMQFGNTVYISLVSEVFSFFITIQQVFFYKKFFLPMHSVAFESRKWSRKSHFRGTGTLEKLPVTRIEKSSTRLYCARTRTLNETSINWWSVKTTVANKSFQPGIDTDARAMIGNLLVCIWDEFKRENKNGQVFKIKVFRDQPRCRYFNS